MTDIAPEAFEIHEQEKRDCADILKQHPELTGIDVAFSDAFRNSHHQKYRYILAGDILFDMALVAARLNCLKYTKALLFETR